MWLTREPSHVDEAISVLDPRPDVQWISRRLLPAKVMTDSVFADHDDLLRFRKGFVPNAARTHQERDVIGAADEQASCKREI